MVPILIATANINQQAEDLASFLNRNKLKAQSFHAGMKPEDKTRVQDDFMASKIPIVSLRNQCFYCRY